MVQTSTLPPEPQLAPGPSNQSEPQNISVMLRRDSSDPVHSALVHTQTSSGPVWYCRACRFRNPYAAMSPDDPHRAKKLLERAFRQVQSKAEEGKKFSNKDLFKLPWKQTGREFSFSGIHIAALHPKGHDVVKLLLERRANAEQPARCEFKTKADDLVEQSVKPLHLAVGMGNLDTIKSLIQFRASVDAKVLSRSISRQGRSQPEVPHMNAFHEAVIFHQSQALSLLLQLGATDVPLAKDETNRNNQTPLHIAARARCYSSAHLLKVAGAKTGTPDKQGQTPLMLAKTNGCRELHLFATLDIQQLQQAAAVDRGSALELLKNRDDWQKKVRKKELRVEAKDVIDLIALDPKVAGELLDVLSITPPPMSSPPMPRVVSRGKVRYQRCFYTAENTWNGARYRDRTQLPPEGFGDCFFYDIIDESEEWGSELPNRNGRFDPKERISIKFIQVPNIINMELLGALSELTADDQLVIFDNVAVQAILNLFWVHMTRNQYIVDLILRGVELSVLLCLALDPQADHLSFWSFLSMMAGRELGRLICQLWGLWAKLPSQTWCPPWKDSKLCSWHFWNICDWLTVALLFYYSVGRLLWERTDDQNMLAVISCRRWIQFLYRWGPLLHCNTQIICVFRSFCRIGGVLTITLFLFVAFAHAFAALGTSDGMILHALGTQQIIETVVLHAFRLLFLADDGGIDFVLSLGTDENIWLVHMFLYISSFIVCICVLNLFIAVAMEEYHSASCKKVELFYAARAQACFDTALLPVMSKPLDKPLTWCLSIQIVGIILWALFIDFGFLGNLGPALVLLLATLLAEFTLRTWPFGKPSCHDKSAVVGAELNSEYLLWWCVCSGDEPETADHAHLELDHRVNIIEEYLEKLDHKMSDNKMEMNSRLDTIEQKLTDSYEEIARLLTGQGNSLVTESFRSSGGGQKWTTAEDLQTSKCNLDSVAVKNHFEEIPMLS